MCGIIGYVGNKDCVPIVISALKSLEYRGYDSAGIAVIDRNKINVRRIVGKVDLLKKLVDKKPLHGTCAIGHTRWATHGKPSQNNAHPHSGCSKDLVIVHNGIIENYISLKDTLKKLGHKFKSETDTEVIAHLIEENLKKLLRRNKRPCKEMLFKAVKLSVEKLKGAYALGVLWSKCPDVLVGVKKQSPLVLGLGKNENFLASDIPAFLDYTRKVVFLRDGEIAVMTPSKCIVYDSNGKETKINVSEISWDRSMAQKGGYKHFMLKEIHEQPQSVENTLRSRLTPPGEKMLQQHFGLKPSFVKKLKFIQIVACGTAYHAGLVGKYIIEKLAKIPVAVDIASEYRYRKTPLPPNSLLIAISQSGETADTIGAVSLNKKIESLAVCNVIGSTITRECNHTFYTHCGPEIGVASTKAFTGQLTAMYVLALHLAVAKKTITAQESKKFAQEIIKIPANMHSVLKKEPNVKNLANKFYGKGHYLFIGRDVNFPIALEGALKIKEIAYVHAEGFAGGEMKHGPIAIIEQGMPVIAIAVQSKVTDKIMSNIKAAQARGGLIIGLITKGYSGLKIPKSNLVELPKTHEYITPFLTVVILQLFAYYVALKRKCDIDQPRNLAKSVTVE
ncbi:MAG TPA: glutamine--fructose-6-phosphate transaminase (isomerizing) [Elusimicrobiales bacterium]|nr:glutamine--fructose-6-phosphate transaminase (isomerizing) [Elusimicrobiales bacterium]